MKEKHVDWLKKAKAVKDGDRNRGWKKEQMEIHLMESMCVFIFTQEKIQKQHHIHLLSKLYH